MARPKKPTTLESIKVLIPTIFQECQKTISNHRKNAMALRKVQEQCAEQGGEAGESAFNTEFIRNLNKVMAVKKKEPVGDRLIQFISSFILCTREKDMADETVGEDGEPVEGISTRFVEYLMQHLLRGVRVREKQVRLRCCQLIALSINSLGAIDDDLYTQLKDSLMERIRDKEPAVRVQAVFALSKLQGGGDEATSSAAEDADADMAVNDSVVQTLLELMQHDPSAEVRRSALFNIEQTKTTLPFVLERARDVDAGNRRGVFAKPMDEIPDFRVLSIGDRERLLRYGLSDRDPTVKKACSKMLATKWIQQADDNLLEFLERLDVMSSNVADDVLMAFFAFRGDILGSLTFNDVFWDNLTVESAFLVRAYAEYCRSADDDLQFERVVPEVTRHAFHIQKYSNIMQESEEDDRPEAEFIVTQLLMIAKLLDYADENGRRKTFNLLREMLMLDDIPDKHLDIIVEIIGKVALNERDFTRIVIEIITDIRASIDEQDFLRNPEDSDSDDDASQDDLSINLDTLRKRKRSIATPSRRGSIADDGYSGGRKAISDLDAKLTRIRCLTITKYMLERSEEPLQQNSYIYGLLNELVIPALDREEDIMQELGLQCLGLICVLDQNLARSNLDLFLTCVFTDRASTILKGLALKIVFDLILTFGIPALSADVTEERITQCLSQSLREGEPQVQAIAAEGVSKLMLTKLFKNEDILKTMILLYFNPSTSENFHLRQCLSYFLQVFFHSAHENQVILAKNLITPVLVDLIKTYRDAKDANEEMATPLLMAQQLLEWAEPNRVLKSLAANKSGDPQDRDSSVDYGLHASVAIELFKEMFTAEPFVRRHLLGALGKARIDADAGESRLKALVLLLFNLKSKRPFNEVALKNNLARFEKTLVKMFEEQPEALDEEQLKKLEELTSYYEFVDGIEEQEPESPMASNAAVARPKASRAGAGTTRKRAAPASKPTASTRGSKAPKTDNAETLEKMQKEIEALLVGSDDEDEMEHDEEQGHGSEDESEPTTSTASKKRSAAASKKPATKAKKATPARRRKAKDDTIDSEEDSPEEEEQVDDDQDEEEESEEELVDNRRKKAAAPSKAKSTATRPPARAATRTKSTPARAAAAKEKQKKVFDLEGSDSLEEDDDEEEEAGEESDAYED